MISVPTQLLNRRQLDETGMLVFQEPRTGRKQFGALEGSVAVCQRLKDKPAARMVVIDQGDTPPREY